MISAWAFIIALKCDNLDINQRPLCDINATLVTSTAVHCIHTAKYVAYHRCTPNQLLRRISRSTLKYVQYRFSQKSILIVFDVLLDHVP